ncbi:MAG TPA: serine/threonine protein kinase, partial [Planctomycetaceae bacterium]|nr:serine/threonine protein kinase [Planctomycetaceae bacterium]
GHVLAVKAGKGNVSESGFAWKHAKTTPDCSTPIVLGDRVFMVTDNGIASCLKLNDGSVVWTKRLNIGTINASLVAGDGKIYVQGIDGKCAVVAADDKGEIISVNEVDGTFYATPAISDGVIYLRAYERIYAIKP